MGLPARRKEEPPPFRPIEEIVPPRAVLTELARGFLLARSSSDPAHAARFARSFLREQAGAPPPQRVTVSERLPSVRRGVAAALREDPLR